MSLQFHTSVINLHAVHLGPYGAATGNSGGEASVHAAPKNAREDNYAVRQVYVLLWIFLDEIV